MTPFTLESGSIVRPEDHAAWLDARLTGIGASEAAALLGVCPYSTPRDLYLRKLGLAPPVEETSAMRQGRHMEAFLADEYRRTFPGVGMVEQLFLRHPEHPHLYATLDGHRPDGIVVEFKTASGRQWANWGADESDDVPENYTCQVQHQMAVSGAHTAHIFASIGGDAPRLFIVPRNERLIGQLIAEASMFWSMVENREPPPATKPSDSRTNHLAFPEPDGQIALDSEACELVDAWEDAKARRTLVQDECDSIRAQLLEVLGAAESGELPDGRRLVRKIEPRPAAMIPRKAYTFTDLRIKARRRDG